MEVLTNNLASQSVIDTKANAETLLKAHKDKILIRNLKQVTVNEANREGIYAVSSNVMNTFLEMNPVYISQRAKERHREVTDQSSNVAYI